MSCHSFFSSSRFETIPFSSCHLSWDKWPLLLFHWNFDCGLRSLGRHLLIRAWIFNTWRWWEQTFFYIQTFNSIYFLLIYSFKIPIFNISFLRRGRVSSSSALKGLTSLWI